MEILRERIEFSSLTEEERGTLHSVLLRQKKFEDLTCHRRRHLRLEILHLEDRLLHCERKSTDIHHCKICFKTKVADCVQSYCKLCNRKTCYRCGARKLGDKDWNCLLCIKKKHYLSSTGDWFIGEDASMIYTQYFIDKLNQTQEKINARRLCRHRSISVATHSEIELEYLSLPPKQRSSVGDTGTMISIESAGSSFFSHSPTYSEFGEMPTLNAMVATNSTESINSNVFNTSMENREFHPMDRTRTKINPIRMRTSEGRPIIERLTLSRNDSSNSLGYPFNVRVVGGKTSKGNIMGAFVTDTIHNRITNMLLRKGDQVIEWNNKSLVDSTFEYTQEIVATSPKTVSVVVGHVRIPTEHSTPCFSQLVSDAIEQRRASFAREAKTFISQEELGKLMETENQPRGHFIKEQVLCHGSENHARIQISLWHDPEGQNLIIKILQAKSLPRGDEMPNPYAIVNLLPRKNLSTQFKTKVEYQSNFPVWNLTFIYSNITEKTLLSKFLEVSLWSDQKTQLHRFIGAVFIQLDQNTLCNVPCWYDIENHTEVLDKITVPVNRRFTVSGDQGVMNSIICLGQPIQRLIRTYSLNKSSRNVRSCIVRSKSSSVPITNGIDLESNRRRRADSSGMADSRCSAKVVKNQAVENKKKTTRSVSDIVVPVMKHKDSSGSIPSPFRRSSLVVPSIHSAPATPSGKNIRSLFCYSPTLLTSRFWQNSSSSKEDVGSMCAGSDSSCSFGSTSLVSERKDISPGIEEYDSTVNKFATSKAEGKSDSDGDSNASIPLGKKKRRFTFFRDNTDTDNKLRSLCSSKAKKLSSSSYSYREDPEGNEPGPNQICSSNTEYQDRGFIRIGLVIEKEELVIDIVRAVLDPFLFSHPDTYVKTYLVDDDRRLLKRKSSIVRQDCKPVYNCRVKYPIKDTNKKTLNVRVLQKQRFRGRNELVGEVFIALHSLNQPRGGSAHWYKLFVATPKTE